MKHKVLLYALTGLFSIALGAGAAGADDVLGRVSSVAGDATAQRVGEEPRALACGDPVYADDTLRTGPGSRVGVMLDDVMTHLDADTRVTLGRTAQSMPSARLEAGKVRMIDPRDAGAPARLAVLDADAQVMGNDAEGYIFSEKVGPYAMLCEWDAPLPVSRGDEQKSADPGECVIAKPKEPLYTADAHDTRIPAVAEVCAPGPELASLNSPLHHLTPGDVAAPGPVAGLGTAGLGGIHPTGAENPGRDACVSAAGSCVLPIPFGAIEPLPVTGLPAPGAGGGGL
jgi:hypothetical protein